MVVRVLIGLIFFHVSAFAEPREEVVSHLTKNLHRALDQERLAKGFQSPFPWWTKVGFGAVTYLNHLAAQGVNLYPHLTEFQAAGYGLLTTGSVLGLSVLFERVFHRFRMVEDVELAIAELREELVDKKRAVEPLSYEVRDDAEYALVEAEHYRHAVSALPTVKSANRRRRLRYLTKWDWGNGLEAVGYMGLCAAGVRALAGF